MCRAVIKKSFPLAFIWEDMNIIPYKPKRTVYIARMYVCGNLHCFMYEPFVQDEKGEWRHFDYSPWFQSPSEAVAWAVAEGHVIDNLEEISPWLVSEAEMRMKFDEFMRRYRVESILPPVPLMIEDR